MKKIQKQTSEERQRKIIISYFLIALLLFSVIGYFFTKTNLLNIKKDIITQNDTIGVDTTFINSNLSKDNDIKNSENNSSTQNITWSELTKSGLFAIIITNVVNLSILVLFLRLRNYYVTRMKFLSMTKYSESYFIFRNLSFVEFFIRTSIIVAIGCAIYFLLIQNHLLSYWFLLPFGIAVIFEILYLIVNVLKYQSYARNSG
jgi:hypothetical protein